MSPSIKPHQVITVLWTYTSAPCIFFTAGLTMKAHLFGSTRFTCPMNWPNWGFALPLHPTSFQIGWYA
jgi:hypothetical protein